MQKYLFALVEVRSPMSVSLSWDQGVRRAGSFLRLREQNSFPCFFSSFSWSPIFLGFWPLPLCAKGIASISASFITLTLPLMLTRPASLLEGSCDYTGLSQIIIQDNLPVSAPLVIPTTSRLPLIKHSQIGGINTWASLGDHYSGYPSVVLCSSYLTFLWPVPRRTG